MPNTILAGLSAKQLRKAASLRERIDALEAGFASLLGSPSQPRGRRRMSAAARAKISAGQKARWTERAGRKSRKGGRGGRRKMSAAGRAKLAANLRKRWAKAKAAGKTSL